MPVIAPSGPTGLLETFELILRTRQLSVAALAFALWEHATTLDLEFELVWRLGCPTTKWMFSLNRYSLVIGLAYSFAVMVALPRSRLNDELCRSSAIIVIIGIVIDIIASNAYLAVRLHHLWDRRKSILYSISVALLATHTTSFCLGVIGIKKMSENMTYNPLLGSCILAVKPLHLTIAWGLIVAFDFMMVVLLTLNSLDRPRHRNKELLMYLKSDNAAFYASALLMRLASLALLIVIPPSKVALTIFYITWPLTSAALSRIILGLEAFQYSSAIHADYLTFEMKSKRWRPTMIEK